MMNKDTHGKRWKMGTILEGFIYRDQKKRYPWWVKSVDKVTKKTDDSIAKQPEFVVHHSPEARSQKVPQLGFSKQGQSHRKGK